MNTITITPTIENLTGPGRERTIWIVGDNIATIYQDRNDLIGTQGMYWVDLAPGMGDERPLFHAADTTDLEGTETDIIPDAAVADPIFHNAAPRLYFDTKENAARFAYDFHQGRRAGSK